MHLLHSLLSERNCLGAQFLKHSLSICPAARVISQLEKNEAYLQSLEPHSILFYLPACKARQVLQWKQGDVCLASATACSHVRKWRDGGLQWTKWRGREGADVRGSERWWNSSAETPTMLSSLLNPLSPPLHDSNQSAVTCIISPC